MNTNGWGQTCNSEFGYIHMAGGNSIQSGILVNVEDDTRGIAIDSSGKLFQTVRVKDEEEDAWEWREAVVRPTVLSNKPFL